MNRQTKYTIIERKKDVERLEGHVKTSTALKMYPDTQVIEHFSLKQMRGKIRWVSRIAWEKTLTMGFLFLLLFGCTTDSEKPEIELGQYVSLILDVTFRLNLRSSDYTLTTERAGVLVYTEAGDWDLKAGELCLYGDLTNPDPCQAVSQITRSGFKMAIDDPELVAQSGQTQLTWVRQ